LIAERVSKKHPNGRNGSDSDPTIESIERSIERVDRQIDIESNTHRVISSAAI
jgi:hypothetical protein